MTGPAPRQIEDGCCDTFADVPLALDNLRAQKTRTVLTALGIVFGVGSVIGMLAIGAGAREESLSFIERLGVRNVLVDSIPATSPEEIAAAAALVAGADRARCADSRGQYRALELLSPRRTLHPARVLPKPSQAIPKFTACGRSYATIHNLRVGEGGSFRRSDESGERAGVRAGGSVPR